MGLIIDRILLTSLDRRLPHDWPHPGWLVPLTACEADAARDLAAGRGRKDRRRVPTRLLSRRHTDEQIDYLGVCSEIAVAIAFGVPINDSDLAFGDNKEPDCRIAGLGCAIRGTFYSRGKLAFKNEQDFGRADAAILVQHHGADTWHVRGWLSRDQYWQRAEPFTAGGTPEWAVDPWRLNHIASILSATRAGFSASRSPASA